ncbi:MAG: hypothetical protein KGL99_03780 [Burkholderiales bacterium]|nr:hypothetical protein [Burkholderiales bacterium]MDE2626252.1 hypothetical protein [Burkholderiales bacterium]
MSTNLKTPRRIATLLLWSGIALGGLALSGCAAVSTAPSLQLLQQIETAHTRADHEALATYYDRQAAAARATAAEHRQMATTYKGIAFAGKGGAGMPAHCNAIVSNYESVAAEYDGMAAGHRQLAEQAKP